MKKIERIACGNGNCFLVQEGDRAILVDTCRTKYREQILAACRQVKTTLIVLTHGHVDHIQNAAWLAQQLQVPIAMHQADRELARNNLLEPLSAHSLPGKLILALSRHSFAHDVIEPFEASVFLKEGASLHEYGVQATVVELPGHTRGSIGLEVWGEDWIVGDALMNMFYPAQSMLYGDRAQMEKSAARISASAARSIHFGHGSSLPNRQW